VIAMAVGCALLIATGAARRLGAHVWAWTTASRRDDRGVADGDIELADLIGLGLSSGMTFAGAARAAASFIGGATEALIVRVLRDPHHSPSGALDRLFATVRASAASGAPVLAAVDGYAASRRSEDRAAALVAVRKLPVKLLFPLALLILPGFVLLTVGPVVAGAVQRLGL